MRFSTLKPVRVTAPASALVSTADAKLQAKVDISDDDALIDAYVAAVTGRFDGIDGTLRRALVTQTWEESFPHFSYEMALKLAPVQSITSIKYYDADNVEQTVSSGVYNLYEKPFAAYVQQASGQSWPAQTYSRDDAVTIRYVCGYGDPADVPAPIIQAVKLVMTHYYENRSAVISGVMATEIPQTVDTLIAPYRRAFTYAGA